MKDYLDKCADINSVGSFCGCISGEESVDPAAEAFCKNAKTSKNVTGDDLAELKMALMDLEEDDDCCCELRDLQSPCGG
jgi:hypothetical protein